MKLLLLSLLFASPVLADHHLAGEKETLPAGLPAQSDPKALTDAGFIALFNGKDLTGWKKVEEGGRDGKFRVVGRCDPWLRQEH